MKISEGRGPSLQTVQGGVPRWICCSLWLWTYADLTLLRTVKSDKGACVYASVCVFCLSSALHTHHESSRTNNTCGWVGPNSHFTRLTHWVRNCAVCPAALLSVHSPCSNFLQHLHYESRLHRFLSGAICTHSHPQLNELRYIHMGLDQDQGLHKASPSPINISQAWNQEVVWPWPFTSNVLANRETHWAG